MQRPEQWSRRVGFPERKNMCYRVVVNNDLRDDAKYRPGLVQFQKEQSFSLPQWKLHTWPWAHENPSSSASLRALNSVWGPWLSYTNEKLWYLLQSREKRGKVHYQLTNKSLHDRQKLPDPAGENSNRVQWWPCRDAGACQLPPGSGFYSHGSLLRGPV